MTDLRTETVDACPACGSPDRARWRSGCRDWQLPQSGQRFDYWTCTVCRTRYLAQRPLPAELEKIYFAGYGPYQANGQPTESASAGVALRAVGLPLRAVAAGLERLRPDRLAQRMDACYTPGAAGDVLLDYGCGSTAFLDAAAARGWSTIGADFSPAVIAAIAEHGHRGVLVGEQLRSEVADGSIRCVRMNHVVEHLYEPLAALRDIRAKLAAGGRIHVSTPNPTGMGSLLFGTRWFDLDCPRHAALYPPAVLAGLLRSCGFDDVEIVDEVNTKDFSRSWGIVRYARGRLAHGEIGGLAADRDRARVIAPLAKLAALAQRADRYHVFAVAR